MLLSFISHLIEGILITPLLIVKSSPESESPLNIVKTTLVPFSPLIRVTASSIVISVVGLSSILIILSPGLKPAFSAGVPSKGAITWS